LGTTLCLTGGVMGASWIQRVGPDSVESVFLISVLVCAFMGW
jgi:hypothetical protein